MDLTHLGFCTLLQLMLGMTNSEWTLIEDGFRYVRDWIAVHDLSENTLNRCW